jgi:hypothetical protein
MGPHSMSSYTAPTGRFLFHFRNGPACGVLSSLAKLGPRVVPKGSLAAP